MKNVILNLSLIAACVFLLTPEAKSMGHKIGEYYEMLPGETAADCYRRHGTNEMESSVRCITPEEAAVKKAESAHKGAEARVQRGAQQAIAEKRAAKQEKELVKRGLSESMN